jgi:hypothetical protein
MKLYQIDSLDAQVGVFKAVDDKWTKAWWTTELHIAKNSRGELQKLTNADPFGPVS